MQYVADLHIHSHFSRATSKNLNLPQLFKWAQIKGVQVVGTGDITHPGWLQELKDGLEPVEDGLFRLKEELAAPVLDEIPPACRAPVRFLLSGEISSIYKKNDRVRKIHNVVFAPSLEAVEHMQAALDRIGNIRSDGRPILGLDSRDLLEILLEGDPQNVLIPAHIWTPWFSLLGSKSGFDSIQECFEDLSQHIFAVETGLSSDPPMNWRVSDLDGCTLISNSDAHSPQKLAREANLFDTELSYPALFAALRSGDSQACLGTIEFFPEEGKYHFDGHRKCDVCWDPKTTLAHNGICPVCGKKVTVGVTHRVEDLADREEGQRPPRALPYHSLIPLPEILGEVNNVGSGSKKVQTAYTGLLAELGPELAILRSLPLADIAAAGGQILAEGIRRMREGRIYTDAGYDGEYGVIRVFDPEEKRELSPQLAMFEIPGQQSAPVKDKEPAAAPAPVQRELPAVYQAETKPAPDVTVASETQTGDDFLSSLNAQQQEAVSCIDRPLIIVAGPGTGKTRTLTHRIAYLISQQDVAPKNILAVTFTNKAAQEMAGRLARLLGDEVATRITIQTFHALGLSLLRESGPRIGLASDFGLCADTDRQAMLKKIHPDLSDRQIHEQLDAISSAKNSLQSPADLEAPLDAVYAEYQQALADAHMLDLDDLIYQSVRLLETCPDLLDAYRDRFRWISVDEYQDINHSQYRLLRLLTGPQTNLCVIGDPDQAIYGFRERNASITCNSPATIRTP